MKEYKIFSLDYICRGYKFSDINMCSGELKICENGFHFCVNVVDCLEYYEYSPSNTYAIVKSVGPVQILDKKVACLGLQNVKQLTYEEFGKLTGKVKTPVLECTYLLGKLHGSYTTYYIYGQIKDECSYKYGKLEGEFTSWYEDGKLLDRGIYKNNRLYGIYKCWDLNGNPKEYNY